MVPALIAAVRDAAGTMVYICGFVVFFLVLLRVMGRVTGLSHPVLSGAVELTQGILALPHTRRGFVWAAGLLGWGGLSVHGQSAAVLSGHGPAHGAVSGGQGRPRRRVRAAGLAGEHVPVKKERTWRCVL